jgi:hypothetical protein
VRLESKFCIADSSNLVAHMRFASRVNLTQLIWDSESDALRPETTIDWDVNAATADT